MKTTSEPVLIQDPRLAAIRSDLRRVSIHDAAAVDRLARRRKIDPQQVRQLLSQGQPELAQMVAEVEPLAQRIAIRFHLKGLDGKETRQYIAFRLERAGAERPLFTEEALDLVWERSQGVPRVINTLCDLSLLEGLATKASLVDGHVVRRALLSL